MGMRGWEHPVDGSENSVWQHESRAGTAMEYFDDIVPPGSDGTHEAGSEQWRRQYLLRTMAKILATFTAIAAAATLVNTMRGQVRAACVPADEYSHN